MKCTECGKSIVHAYYIDGKPYGYNCYKKILAVKFQQWEDEKNTEYARECFSAMEVFKCKANNTFHDSICKQWEECKKLTGKQLSCIKSGFTSSEKIDFWCIWFNMTEDKSLKRSICSWLENDIRKNKLAERYMDNDSVNEMLLYLYPCGFHYYTDELYNGTFFSENGYYIGRMEDKKPIYNNSILDEHNSFDDYKVLKVVTVNN